MKKQIFAGGLVCAILSMSQSAYAQQSFSKERPIVIVVADFPGTVSDLLGRRIAAAMAKTLGATVDVVTSDAYTSSYRGPRDFAGVLPTRRVAKAPADGYTLLLHNARISGISSLFEDSPVDVENDLLPIGLVATMPMTLVTPVDSALSAAGDWISYAKANPEKISITHFGVGSASFLCAMALKDALKIDVSMVSTSTGLAILDNLKGDTMLCNYASTVNSRIKAGKLRSLVTAQDRPSPDIPSVKTFSAQGLEGVQFVTWYGLWTTNGVPKSIVDILNSALKASLKDSGVRAVLEIAVAEAADESSVTPIALQKRLRQDMERLTLSIKKSDISSEK